MPDPAKHDDQNLTHLGWRSLPADSGDGQDRLLLSDPAPLFMAPPHEAQTPQVEFVEPKGNGADEGESMIKPLQFLEVQDSAFEVPPFLWGGDDNVADEAAPSATAHQPDTSTPLVVFGADSDRIDAPAKATTVFS